MQIIKYLLYLIILTFVSILVYIATLENRFDITNNYAVNVKTYYIKNYFNDPLNWANINHLKNDTLSAPEKFFDSQTDLQLKLDSVATNFTLFSVYLGDDKIGKMAYQFSDSLGTHTEIDGRFYGEVDFLDKINIFTKGISPRFYFSKIFNNINHQMQNQLETDFSYHKFDSIQVIYQPKTYYYKSRFASADFSREEILNAYQLIKSELDTKNASGNIFFIEMVLDTPNRKEFFVGVPVNQKLAPVIKSDIYLDSLRADKVLKTSFSGNITFQETYDKAIEKQIQQQEIKVDYNSKINIWNEQIKFNNPKKWTFETWYYLKPEINN
ncbi:hypothetical protein K5I29_05310 [Flavobacterium agricola]|uniref:AraC family transcriptional regulator n=1 Tax=Flavobacterium agricola TaxID=2870839 RepID=A0ABY6M4Y0_9FLAO|nr:hypothetical protein [Flavobacterium agricola]UYW02318.1 hypothetical protein K5I29_05310 [Flavobacterium agricola]